MGEPIRVGLIGSGGISRAHVRGYRSLGEREVRVVVTCDVSETLAAERARDVGADAAMTDWRAVLDRDDLDAVDLCLPHDLHAEVAVAAAQSGKHVLVEKPMATTLADADAMIAAAKAAGTILMCAFCERYDPAHLAIKRIIDDGLLGAPMMARIDHNQNVRMPEGHWIRSASRLGGGAIASAGCHRIDLLRWFFGEIVAVSAFTFRWPERMEGEVAGSVNFRFENGAIGNLMMNWMSFERVWYEKLWLEGTEGSIHNHGGVHVHTHLRDDWAEGYHPIETETRDAFTEEIRHFLECIRDGKQPLTHGEDAKKTMAVALAAYESERTGAVVNPFELG